MYEARVGTETPQWFVSRVAAVRHLVVEMGVRIDHLLDSDPASDVLFELSAAARFLVDAQPERFDRTIDGVRYLVVPYEH